MTYQKYIIFQESFNGVDHVKGTQLVAVAKTRTKCRKEYFTFIVSE